MTTSNRAAALLIVIVTFVYYMVLPMRAFKSIDRFGRQFKLVLVAAIVVPIIGVYVGLDRLEKDFGTLSGANFSIGGILSGKDINRGGLADRALNRINSETFIVGYGYGVPRYNIWAWMGIDSDKQQVMSDYHSLYLSLPMLYGWVGSLAFLGIVVLTAYRLFSVSIRYRSNKSFLSVLSIGFTMFWAVFLIHEYKINILRNPNYQMLFWIWLGLSNSVVKSLRYNIASEVPPQLRQPEK